MLPGGSHSLERGLLVVFCRPSRSLPIFVSFCSSVIPSGSLSQGAHRKSLRDFLADAGTGYRFIAATHLMSPLLPGYFRVTVASKLPTALHQIA